MRDKFRLLFVGGMPAVAVLLVAVGLARTFTGLLTTPTHLILFAITLAGYFLPTALAFYRGLKASPWIALVNALLGWTLFGWVVALGWAASGEVRPRSAGSAVRWNRPSPAHR